MFWGGGYTHADLRMSSEPVVHRERRGVCSKGWCQGGRQAFTVRTEAQLEVGNEKTWQVTRAFMRCQRPRVSYSVQGHLFAFCSIPECLLPCAWFSCVSYGSQLFCCYGPEAPALKVLLSWEPLSRKNKTQLFFLCSHTMTVNTDFCD